MPRSRSIKPGFYSNEDLAECSHQARLLFPALWQMADRRGRLEDRPKRIKAYAWPFENADVESQLNELIRHGFLVRYSVCGRKLLWIAKFKENQHCHKDEAESELPPFDDAATVEPPYGHDASTVAAPCEHDKGTAPIRLVSVINNLESVICNQQSELPFAADAVARDEPPSDSPPKDKKSSKPPSRVAAEIKYLPEFEAWWLSFPSDVDGRRRDKKRAYGEWTKISAREYPALEQATKHYSASDVVKRGKVMKPVNWLNEWRDWIAPPAAKSTKGSVGPKSVTPGRDAYEAFYGNGDGSGKPENDTRLLNSAG